MPLNTSMRVKRHGLERVFRVRLANLRGQVALYGTQAALARALGVSEAHLTRVIGENPVKTIGEKMARDYETKLRLPSGTLDIAR